MPAHAKLNKDSAFNLDNQHAYENWRDAKLENYPEKAEQLIVEINDPTALTKSERKAIIERCNKSNMTVYISGTGSNPDKRIASELAKQFGLRTLDRNMGADDDGITSLQVSQSQGRERYIPYTNNAIHWHTDGYYNKRDQQIHALCLHCVRSAQEGGTNSLLDHEIAYIKLRDENPDYIRALMSPNAMTIPANIKDGVMIRPDRSGPVFSVRGNDILHMRYTERAHNIIWNDDAVTQVAIEALVKLLHSDHQYIFTLTLQPGWGLISNNVLHDRSGFNDDKDAPRLLYRLRYFEGLDRS